MENLPPPFSIRASAKTSHVPAESALSCPLVAPLDLPIGMTEIRAADPPEE